jgi:hypothetical protein
LEERKYNSKLKMIIMNNKFGTCSYATLSYTFRKPQKRTKLWIETAGRLAWVQYEIAKELNDFELQMKCCVWLVYALIYEWHFEKAKFCFKSNIKKFCLFFDYLFCLYI